MKNKKFYFSVLACLIPVVIGLLFYNQLPDTIPSHWNGAGEIDGYMDKNFVIFGTPIFMIGIQTLVIWAMCKDPKFANIPKVMFNLMYVFIPVLYIIIMSISINSALDTGIDLNVGTIMEFLIGVLFLLIGNYMPKCKQSYTVGIKTPWALDDEENWNKTHRFAGFLWTAGGIIMFVLALLQTNMDTSFILIGIVLIMAIIPYIYSYLLYSKKQKSQK